LLASIELSERGDLYVPADDSYLKIARDKDLIDEEIPLVRMTPILAVQKGNPLAIRDLDDVLERKDVKLAQANPDAAAVGKLTREVLPKDKWQELKKRTLVFKPTVTDVANDLVVGTVDAGIIFDALLPQYPQLERVPAPALEKKTAHVSVGVLRCTRQPTAALHFARYLGARDRGLREFQKLGYQTVEGDRWADRPEIRLMAGAMLRPAIDQTIQAFEEREGVHVVKVYNGCGILVASMKTGDHPDAYFACDASFMTKVSDLFLDSTEISTNQLVILVHKGNPRGIHSLQDLTKPGLKVGVGHERQCAMGALTEMTLRQGGIREPVNNNVVVRSATGDMLVNQLHAAPDSLDAVIAYISNAANCDDLESIPIDVPCATAVQPFAIGKESDFKQLTGRLLKAIRSKSSREAFEANRFQWKARS
jgi:ABC-type molybdate transport system substrate-binding protein